MENIHVDKKSLLYGIEYSTFGVKTDIGHSKIHSMKIQLPEDEYFKWLIDNVIVFYRDKSWRIYDSNECHLVSLDFNVVDYVNQKELEAW